MDLDEWEILPNEKFFDYHEDDHAKTRSLFKVNHFMCPSSPPKRFSRVVPNHVVPLPIQLEPPMSGNNIDVVSSTSSFSEQVTKVVPSDISLVPCVIMPDVKKQISGSIPTATCPKEVETEQESVSSQVFFKKTEQFVDKILDSPKSCSYVPPQQIEVFPGGDQAMEAKISSPRTPRIKKEQENVVKEEIVSWEEESSSSGGMNLWKWSLTGIGAICSFGVAAATICIIIFGSHQRNKQRQQNQKLRFQIYTDDKQRIKQVVQHATKLNEAISAVRGVPIQRAHITIGGYYDGL